MKSLDCSIAEGACQRGDVVCDCNVIYFWGQTWDCGCCQFRWTFFFSLFFYVRRDCDSQDDVSAAVWRNSGTCGHADMHANTIASQRKSFDQRKPKPGKRSLCRAGEERSHAARERETEKVSGSDSTQGPGERRDRTVLTQTAGTVPTERPPQGGGEGNDARLNLWIIDRFLFPRPANVFVC